MGVVLPSVSGDPLTDHIPRTRRAPVLCKDHVTVRAQRRPCQQILRHCSDHPDRRVNMFTGDLTGGERCTQPGQAPPGWVRVRAQRVRGCQIRLGLSHGPVQPVPDERPGFMSGWDTRKRSSSAVEVCHQRQICRLQLADCQRRLAHRRQRLRIRELPGRRRYHRRRQLADLPQRSQQRMQATRFCAAARRSFPAPVHGSNAIGAHRQDAGHQGYRGGKRSALQDNAQRRPFRALR